MKEQRSSSGTTCRPATSTSLVARWPRTMVAWHLWMWEQCPMQRRARRASQAKETKESTKVENTTSREKAKHPSRRSSTASAHIVENGATRRQTAALWSEIEPDVTATRAKARTARMQCRQHRVVQLHHRHLRELQAAAPMLSTTGLTPTMTRGRHGPTPMTSRMSTVMRCG